MGTSYIKGNDVYFRYPFAHPTFLPARRCLDYEWNADNMAELANMSKTQFYHYYTYIFKQTPKAELIHARMEYSKFLLTNRALPISQIASLIGYSNESHYIRSFKKFYGISPKQYALNIQREMADSAKENNP